jgi:hypothetical protein
VKKMKSFVPPPPTYSIKCHMEKEMERKEDEG